MSSIILKVEGMSCNHCVNTVEKAMKELGAEGKVNLAGKLVEVEYDESKLTVEAIKEAIEEQGYDVVQ
ncbi:MULTISPECIES: copper ion binding protein [Paenibacillus]|uniref:Copper ion binding protein n=2 Tax=Paenibacillus TaxID=44249 RepID=A0ABU6DN02_9BACL|nr:MULTISPECIES: copper ion binding protein [Paenibacillus]MBA2943518.1 heavy-metal-associated domain-containing protein [Paenibacillus sp. CGMCC 1.16610]MCY9657456.1 copper ion binding protein [Paenibacillus anseongense]MEB4798710.1 copper ion binding protein [Paenibacillus chondroitinus]MVQ39669.1 copper ion binding protein [Paenibacillus anseongense]